MCKVNIIFVIVASAAVVAADYFEHSELLGNDLEKHHEQIGDSEQHHYGSWGGESDLHETMEHKEDEHPKDYNYDYAVHDPHSESYHSHQESSKDGVVKGYYSLKEADGSLREVHYTADKENGFKAIVTKNGEQVHPHTEESSH